MEKGEPFKWTAGGPKPDKDMWQRLLWTLPRGLEVAGAELRRDMELGVMK